MSLHQLFAILRARWKLVSAIIVAAIVTTLTVSIMLPKRYAATATVVVDVKSPDPVAGMVLQGMMTPGYMATQIDILKSPRVADLVVKRLGLSNNAQLKAQWESATGGQGSFDVWLTDLIMKPLDVVPARDSTVIRISYAAANPAFAAEIANAFAQSYIDTTIQLRVDPAKRYVEMFGEQVNQFRDRLEAARSRLSQFQQKQGLTATDERLDIETARLNELSTQLVYLQGLSAESASRQSQAQQYSDRLSDVINNPLISGLRAELLRQEAKLKELSARFGEGHPTVIEIKASIFELRTKLDAETRRVASSVGLNNSINKSREAQMRAAIAQQRERVLEMKAQRDKAAVYLQDVESAQRAYDAMLTRLNQAKLESENGQTNVAILRAAVPPADHDSPKVLVNTLLSIFFGSILAFAAAFIVEFMDRRVRTAEDITVSFNVPILAELPIATASPDGAVSIVQRIEGTTSVRPLLGN